MARKMIKTCGILAALTSCTLLPALFDNAQAATPFTVITNWYAEAEHGGFYQAEAEGLYQKAGLDVNVKMGGPQINPAQLLGAGRSQCAVTDDEIGTMTAIQQGLPITVVATSFQRVPIALIAHSDVTKFSQLASKTILLSSETRQAVWPWLQKTKGFTNTTTRPYTFNIQPFIASDQVAQQGYVTSEPYALKKAGAKINVFPLGQQGYPSYGNVIACRNDVIEKHPEEVAAFVHATMQGWKDYLANPAKGDALIIKANPDMTQGQLDYAVDQIKKLGLVEGGDAATKGIGIITPARIEASWNFGSSIGLVDKTKVPLKRAYTTKFIDQNPVMP